MCLEKEIFFFAGLCACGPMSWAQEVIIIFVHSTGFTGVASSAFDLKLSTSIKCISNNKTHSINHTPKLNKLELVFHVAFYERCFRKETMFAHL